MNAQICFSNATLIGKMCRSRMLSNSLRTLPSLFIGTPLFEEVQDSSYDADYYSSYDDSVPTISQSRVKIKDMIIGISDFIKELLTIRVSNTSESESNSTIPSDSNTPEGISLHTVILTSICYTIVASIILLIISYSVYKVYNIIFPGGAKLISNRSRKYAPKMMHLKSFWTNLAPPSLQAEDTPVVLTEHDFEMAKTCLSTMLSFDAGKSTVRNQFYKQALAERDDDGNLIMLTEYYPLQAHYEFEIRQRSAEKVLSNFKFGEQWLCHTFPTRLQCAKVTFMAHFGAGIAHLFHACLSVPFILFAPEDDVKSMLVEPRRVLFCRNASKVEPVEEEIPKVQVIDSPK